MPCSGNPWSKLTPKFTAGMQKSICFVHLFPAMGKTVDKL